MKHAKNVYRNHLTDSYLDGLLSVATTNQIKNYLNIEIHINLKQIFNLIFKCYTQYINVFFPFRSFRLAAHVIL